MNNKIAMTIVVLVMMIALVGCKGNDELVLLGLDQKSYNSYEPRKESGADQPVVPEPATILLMSAGLGGAYLLRKKK